MTDKPNINFPIYPKEKNEMEKQTETARKAHKPTTENQKSSGSQTKQQPLAVNDIKKRYGNANNFLLIFNKNIQPVVAANIERAYLGTAPSLMLVEKTYNTKLAIVWLMAQLENLNDYVGVNQKMNLNQMEEVAQIIISSFRFLKVTEIHLFLHRLKSGQYGEFYGSIDPVKVMNCLRIFLKERNTEIAFFEQMRSNRRMEKLREEWKRNGITRDEYEKIKNK